MYARDPRWPVPVVVARPGALAAGFGQGDLRTMLTRGALATAVCSAMVTNSHSQQSLSAPAQQQQRSPGSPSSTWAADLGIINAASAPFSADPTAKRDSTAALQAAIDAGYRHNMTVFLPHGVYRVTNTLNCSQTWDGTWFPPFRVGSHVLVGETPREDGVRPTLWLPPDTPGFGNRSAGKIVLFFWHQDAAAWPASEPKTQPMNNINQVLQGIDIRIGAGNYGAVGVRHRGAQGSSLEDVTVWAGDARYRHSSCSTSCFHPIGRASVPRLTPQIAVMRLACINC